MIDEIRNFHLSGGVFEFEAEKTAYKNDRDRENIRKLNCLKKAELPLIYWR